MIWFESGILPLVSLPRQSCYQFFDIVSVERTVTIAVLPLSATEVGIWNISLNVVSWMAATKAIELATMAWHDVYVVVHVDRR